MKIKILSIIIIFFNITFCYAFGPNKTIGCSSECVDKEFGYRFCKINNDGTTTTEYKCSKDPHNEPGLKLICQSIPMCFDYKKETLKSVPDRVGAYVGTLEMTDFISGEKKVVFTGAHEYIEEYIRRAIEEWTKLCKTNPNDFFIYDNPDSPPLECCVKFYWSQDPTDFKFPGYADDDYALMVTRVKINPNQCKMNCNESHIRMNDCEKFLKRDPNNKLIPIARRFFYMRDIGINYGFPTSEVPLKYKDKNDPTFYMEYYDFYSALMHELGHWFGFGDEEAHESCTTLSNNYEGVMKGYHDPLVNYNLSSDDMCLFRKVYCCSESFTSVDEFLFLNFTKFDIFPNPASNKITINFTSKILGNVYFEVVDINGKVYFKNSSNLTQENVILNLDISNYPIGSYYIKTQISDKIIGYKFIKQ